MDIFACMYYFAYNFMAVATKFGENLQRLQVFLQKFSTHWLRLQIR